MEIRAYRDTDAEQTMAVFYSAIRENANGYYSEAQLTAWAPDMPDMVQWQLRMNQMQPFVAVENDIIYGYADLRDDGYIDHFFVRGGSGRSGVGRLMMAYLINRAEALALPSMTSEVSLAAQGFFRRFGFVIEKRQKVVIRGVTLENAWMRKTFNL
ncbi:GNAT family N-acetyltransferase [Fusibacter paucivorans]|uniref:GNAT family N-acetyltransferase n=1 Tax=Fusibacter paucivorans TaxID=76009 RepID=A0ABS5PLP1_9FIRM|nr:GNAT family N-acetyltransferase [Fusibacter paucivorans]MBS7525319.1 GNAT family N-acetyltransferase [Fusibacter paucivorans]